MPRWIDTVPIPGSTFTMGRELFPAITGGLDTLPILGRVDLSCKECAGKKFRSEGGYSIYCDECNAPIPVINWSDSAHRSVVWRYDPIPPEATNYGKD